MEMIVSYVFRKWVLETGTLSWIVGRYGMEINVRHHGLLKHVALEIDAGGDPPSRSSTDSVQIIGKNSLCFGYFS